MEHRVLVRVDASSRTGKLEHNWNYIGYDECNYTHSPGGMRLLQEFGKLEKPYYVRAHHMLCTGILHAFYKWGSTNVYAEDEGGQPLYDFTTIDKMMDILLRSNLKPFFELGFMPRDLADPREAENGEFYQIAYGSSEYQRVGWAMPPKDYGKWHDLIYAIVRHLTDRYGAQEVGSWYFEMWNEPDSHYYWHGTPEEFQKLYDYTEAAVHAALPTARLGGPATCGSTDPDGRSSSFLRSFLAHTRSGVNYVTGATGTRIDYTTFHTKGGGYSFRARAKKQIPSVKVLLKNVETQARIIREAGYGDLECVLSEADPDGWAAGGRFDNANLVFRNTEYYASYMASSYKNLFDLSRSLRMDIRPLAWAFMFEAERCFEGTRTFSTQGIRKPVFNLLRLYAMLGQEKLALTSSRGFDPLSYADKNGTAEGPEISGWATAGGDDRIQVLLYCHHDDWDVNDSFDIALTLDGLPYSGPVRVRHYRIDGEHSNAHAEWVRQGCPDYPEAGQYDAIKSRDGLEYCEAPETVLVTNGKIERSFSLPTHGISLLLFERA